MPLLASVGASAGQQLPPPLSGSALVRARWQAAGRAIAVQLAARKARAQARLATLRQLNHAHLAMRARLLLARIAELVALQAPPPGAKTGSSSRARSSHVQSVPRSAGLSLPLTHRSSPRGATSPAEEIGGLADTAPDKRVLMPPGLLASQADLVEQPSSLHLEGAPARALEVLDPPQPCSDSTGCHTSAATGRPATVDAPVTPRSEAIHPRKRPRPASAPTGRAGENPECRALHRSPEQDPSTSSSRPQTVPALRAARGAGALASLRTPRSARGPRGGGTAGALGDADALAAYREELALVLSLLSPFLGGLPAGPLRALCADATADTAVSGQAPGLL